MYRCKKKIGWVNENKKIKRLPTHNTRYIREKTTTGLTTPYILYSMNTTNTTTQNGLSGMCYVYARTSNMTSFRAFDLEGHFAGNLIFASMLHDNEDNRRKLQELATANNGIGLALQLRESKGKVTFQTN